MKHGQPTLLDQVFNSVWFYHLPAICLPFACHYRTAFTGVIGGPCWEGKGSRQGTGALFRFRVPRRKAVCCSLQVEQSRKIDYGWALFLRMKYALAVILFFCAVGGFASIANYSHRRTIETNLTAQGKALLDKEGYREVSVRFDHFDAVLGGYVESEQDKRRVLALIRENVPCAYVPEENSSKIQIKPSLPPWISMTREAGTRRVLLEGHLAITEEENRKFLGSSLHMINGVDLVQNEIELDTQRLPFTRAADFASLAAGLIPASRSSSLRLDDTGLTVGGLVENEAVKKDLLLLAEKLSPGKVTDQLKVKTLLSARKKAAFHLEKSRFGVTVSGTVADLDTKAKLFEAMSDGNGTRVRDSLDINSDAETAWWIDDAVKLIPQILAATTGDAEIHFTDEEVKVTGKVELKEKLTAIQAELLKIQNKLPSLLLVSELSLNGIEERADLDLQPNISVVFDQKTVELTGQLPSESARNLISSNIVTTSINQQIINKITVEKKLFDGGWLEEFPGLLNEMTKAISSGSLTVKSGKVTLSGMTRGVEEKQLLQNMAVNLFPSDYQIANLLTFSDQPFPAPGLVPDERAQLTEKLQALPVYFDLNSAKLKPDESKKVKAAAKEILGASKEYSISVGGFADTSGHAAYNRKLSIRRAEAVKDQLIRLGVKAGNLKTESFGEDQSQMAKSEQWKGRRVEIRPLIKN